MNCVNLIISHMRFCVQRDTEPANSEACLQTNEDFNKRRAGTMRRADVSSSTATEFTVSNKHISRSSATNRSIAPTGAISTAAAASGNFAVCAVKRITDKVMPIGF